LKHNVVRLRDTKGPTKKYCKYDAYGKAAITARGADALWYTADDVTLTTSAYHNPFTFTGRQLDILDNNTLRLYFYRDRSYDPQTGRFMQRDPLEYIDGMNLYEYVKNSPILYLDPSGNSSVDRGICQLIAQGKKKEAISLIMLVYGYTYYQAQQLVDGTTTCPTIPPISLPRIELPPRTIPRNLPVLRGQCQDKRRCPAPVEAMINGIIFAICKTPGLTCKGTDTRELRETKTAMASACLSARLAMKLWCYPDSIGKGDHSQAIQQAENRLNDCLTKLTID
jgi:RHS repeat-associated protein